MDKKNKLDKILEAVDKRSISAYELSKSTGLNESGLNRLLKNEVKNPHLATIDKLYSFLYNTNTVLDNASDSILDEKELIKLVHDVAINEDALMEHKVFSNIIEIRVAKRIAVILSSDEEYKKWRNS